MSDRPDISVVMSVYNGASTLRETLDSIRNQRGVDFEIIVIDDGSTDGTAAILDQFASGDARLRVIHQENQGLTRSLVTGCAAARGRHIARHDAGDLSAPERLLEQRRALDGDERVAFVSCWTEYVGPKGELLYDFRGSGRAVEPQMIIDPRAPHCHIDGPTHHGSVMFRRDAYELAGGYRPAFRFGQDWDLWYRLAEIGRFQMIGKVLYTARISPDSISTRAHGTQIALSRVMEEMVRVRANGGSDALLLERARKISHGARAAFCAHARGLYFIGEALRRKTDPRCRRYLLRAAMRCPLLLKSWVRLAQSLVMR